MRLRALVCLCGEAVKERSLLCCARKPLPLQSSCSCDAPGLERCPVPLFGVPRATVWHAHVMPPGLKGAPCHCWACHCLACSFDAPGLERCPVPMFGVPRATVWHAHVMPLGLKGAPCHCWACHCWAYHCWACSCDAPGLERCPVPLFSSPVRAPGFLFQASPPPDLGALCHPSPLLLCSCIPSAARRCAAHLQAWPCRKHAAYPLRPPPHDSNRMMG